MTTTATTTAQDLRRSIAAAAIRAAETRLADYGRFGWAAPHRPELIAAVVVEALSWFEMDHDTVWNRETWTECAQSAIEHIETPETVASVIRHEIDAQQA